ncbi:uncharacterized protein B0H18DRAFT_1113166 [Fomitopsis serialis]|uniref:uncharacterized protein n=1 Tax=Fomitopsis serialis TaxID=139415 RepID=UPI002008D010|nr:uncharacterized protein B0H18DRAFT_1113166 [Neoantrodia serialis]KAH9937309.1 hypothetical protein B0H18DRAFT_1113166 [Neoantrodia serialis]
MPSSILPPGHSKSSWWSRSKTGKEPSVKPMRSFSSLSDDNEKSSTSSMFPPSTKSKDTSGLSLKTLGSAISFKSKKVASLTIQNIPSDVPIQAPPPPSPPADFGADQTSVAPSILYSNRIPTIKSIRTDRSTELDNDARSARTASEPRTPSDYRTSYQPSVLTFSELDPFASSGVIVQQGHDPNRLSAYSDSSMLEPTHKRGEILFYNRISYASSSSKSQGHSSDSHSMAIASPRSSRFSRPEGSRQNTAGTRDSSLAPPVSPLASPRRQSPSGSSGSTVRTGEGPSRLSEPVPGNLTFQRASSSFLQRPRGMTIGASGSSDWRPSTANPALPSAVPARLRKASDAPPASPKGSSSAAPSSSASPIASSRSRSSTVNSAESFESPNMSPSSTAHPLVVVRKASSTRVTLPPLSRAPSQDLPPTPFPESDFGASDSLDDLSLFPDAPSSSSSSMSFAPSMDLDMATVTGDMINQLMLHGYEDPSESKSKGKGRASRRKANSTSPSDTLRDFELVHPGPSSSTSKLPSMPASSEGGSADLTGGIYSASMRSLQRVSSQQSLLGNRMSGASQSSAASGSRSFHHSRLPLPPIPALRHATSDVASPASPSSPPLEQRKSSSSGHQPTRKRLFSGSSARRSTSSHGPSSNAMSGDEDNRSIYSVDDLRAAGQKIVMSFGSFANPLSLLTSNACVAPGSYLPDANMTSTTSPDPQTPQTPTGPSPSNRASQTEYIPQHIMSPADMLKLEQQLAQEAVDREQRDEDELPDEVVDPNVSTSKADHRLSVVSAATSAFGNDNSFRQRRDKTPVSSPPSKPSALPTPASRMRSAAGESSRLPFRSHSALMSAPRKPSLSLRPSTATSGLPPQATSIAASSDSPQQAPWSLPPPPRSRPVRDPPPSKSESGKRLSTVPLQPLSPPPTRLRARISSLQGPAITQRPSPASISRSPSAFGNKVMHRKSLMKKPSFLDIEDEADATSESLMDVNLDALDSPTMDSSFLDMDRGKDSFDTVRSSDSLLFV